MIGFWYRLAIVVATPPLRLFTRRDWRGREHIPPTGAVIVAANHISRVDPFTCADYLLHAGRVPRFLAKIELFGMFFVRWVMYGAGQIPVYRHAENAAESLRDAVAALRRGECVLIYPEGTVTGDPDCWPMRAHTGVGRLALETGAPVVPLGSWGTHLIHDQHKKLHLLPRHTVRLTAGPPVDLSAYAGRPPTPDVVHAVVDAVMRDLRDLVADLRGEAAPAALYDPRASERSA